MHRNVAFFYGCGLTDTEPAVCGKPAFDAMYDRLLAACLRYPDFAVWHHISYEKLCCAMYARAVQLGIRSVLITGGDVDDDQKIQYLTDFDSSCKDVQAAFSTAAVTVGMNFNKRFNACTVVTGHGGSTAVDAAQSAGRPGRVDGMEFDTILWLIADASPPKPDEALVSMAVARRAVERKRLDKTRYASRVSLQSEVIPQQLLEVKAVNEMDAMNRQSHTALVAQKLVEYKPGWNCIDPACIVLPPRLAALSDADVDAIISAARPLPLDQIQRLASLPEDRKMKVGLDQLIQMARDALDKGGFTSYGAAEKDVLDSCGGMFAHSHLSDTFIRNQRMSEQDKVTVKAWKAARHFGKLDLFSPKQLVVVNDYEDKLNLAACHLGLGSRRVQLARQLLKSIAQDGAKVGLYTRLPERVDALERACKLIGVSCLAIQRQVLGEDHPFVRLLQLDKMGTPSVEVRRRSCYTVA